MAKKEKNLSQEQIKIRILAFLFNYDEEKKSVNANTIQHKANIRLQEYSRLRDFLEELCILKCLGKHEVETAGSKPRINYFITEQGKKIVTVYRESLQSIFGSIEDSFGNESIGYSTYP